MCQQKLLHVYVYPYFTHCMEVACWHKGVGEMFSSPKPRAQTVNNFYSEGNMLYSVHAKANTLKNNCYRQVIVLHKLSMTNSHSFVLSTSWAVVH